MSLSWCKRYVAVLGLNRVGLCRREGREVEWLGSSDFDSERQPAWREALVTLERLLLERAIPGADLQVLLSSAYTRVFLVPWREQIASPTELQAFARMCFDDIYGAQEEEWLLRVSPERTGMPRVASAMALGMEAGLRALSAACSLKLVSVQPYLMAAFNHFRTHLPEDDLLFVLAEQGRSSLLFKHEGRWASVRTVTGVDGGDALCRLIDRERGLLQASGAPVPAVYVHTPGHDELPDCMGVRLQTLSLPLPKMALRDALYVMAQAVS